ncbi:YafY family protein [Streptomyces sp. AC512_CC834]|uniref:helix-turn-helix transcriptional regulator n=1 Tax=Streptomyces sp. AC512_CC834 TaxID=2823691 RepID=UPI001C265F02|nr:WYL domain-containing protein [Streptomyces sp. AC512_CC834]
MPSGSHAGGYRLLDGYRTRLTGLTAAEAETLFLAGVPGPAAEPGLGGVLAAAQLKVRAADRISDRFHLDAPGWYADPDETPYLPTVADAVWNRTDWSGLTSAGTDFTRPAGFDLAVYWAAYQRDFHGRLHRDRAVVRLAPGVTLTGPAGEAVRANGRADPDGWTRATVPVESMDHAHGGFLRLGAGIEVVEPAGLRTRFARTAAQLVERYGNPAAPGGD